MKFCAFDLEIVKPIPAGCKDWKEIRPLGISCAATKCSGQDIVQWFPHNDNGNIIMEYDSDGNLIPTPMSRDEVCELVGYLVGISKQGFTPVTWNGLGFDFDILAEESGMFDICRDLALNHVDMMFQFLCVRGHPLGMDAAAKGVGLPGKPEGMHGDLAPDMWVKSAEDRLKVLDYVASDAENTLGIAEAVQKNGGQVSWVSKSSGRYNIARLGEWLTVEQAAMLPLPDTSWMTNPMQRGTLMAWTEKQEEKAQEDYPELCRFSRGNLRGNAIKYPDGVGCCVWYLMPDSEDTGLCFDLPASDIDNLIELLTDIKKEIEK